MYRFREICSLTSFWIMTVPENPIGGDGMRLEWFSKHSVCKRPFWYLVFIRRLFCCSVHMQGCTCRPLIWQPPTSSPWPCCPLQKCCHRHSDILIEVPFTHGLAPTCIRINFQACTCIVFWTVTSTHHFTCKQVSVFIYCLIFFK